MRLVRLFYFGLALVTMGIVHQRAVAAPTEDGLPKPIWFGQLAFSIPFNVQPSLPAEQQPAQVQLYVTTDRGATWRLAQTISPQAKNFDFRAQTEGEYGFLIRTVDRGGRITPEAAGAPELRVIVDTTPPKLELTALRGPSGEIRATWKATDPLLNAESLKIEYQISTGTWRQVAIDRTQATVDDANCNGSVTWWPSDVSPPPASATIRAEIRDRAGNPTRVQAKSQAAAADQFNPTNGDQFTNNPGNPWPDAATTWPSQSNRGPLDRNVATNTNNRAQEQPQDIARSTGWNPQRDRRNEYQSREAPDYNQAMVSPINPPIRNQMPITDESRDVRRTDPSRRENENRVVNNPPPANGLQANNNRPALPRSQEPQNSRSGEQPRLVNSKSFEMDYEIESIGPSGIAKVELWGTRDGGRTWNSYGVDNDNRSPIRVSVDGEGLYGFRIAVQSGSGLGSPLPRAGDQPEVLIAVDLAKPNVRLTDVQTGVGQRAGEMLIRWETTDAALAVHPVTLLYADKPSGPWSIIAANLDSSGSYAWRPDERIPDQVYLRVEARDEAGNIGVYESADPIPLDRIRPEGRIRGIRPVINSASRVQIYQFSR